MGTSGDKIVLLDGMGSGSGSAANGLLSMIPGMFTSLLGGNKMDPNLVAALMNGRNNQDQIRRSQWLVVVDHRPVLVVGRTWLREWFWW